MKRIVLVRAVVCLSAALAAQVAPPTTMPTQASTANLNAVLAQIEQTAQAANLALARLRIEKWKTDSSVKRQSQSDSDSVQRNVSAALPTLVSAVRSAPDDLSATFKLYRNLSALADVMRSLTESAGAFGPKDDFEALNTETGAMDQVRRQLGESLEATAAAQRTELLRLRSQARTQAGTAASTAGKRIIVDDNQPKKTTSPKKKLPAKKPAGTPTTPQ
jgi:hypothetical protein